MENWKLKIKDKEALYVLKLNDLLGKVRKWKQGTAQSVERDNIFV